MRTLNEQEIIQRLGVTVLAMFRKSGVDLWETLAHYDDTQTVTPVVFHPSEWIEMEKGPPMQGDRFWVMFTYTEVQGPFTYDGGWLSETGEPVVGNAFNRIVAYAECFTPEMPRWVR